MTHLAAALFFGMIFIGAGVAAQALIREFRREIVAALLGQPPVRRPAPAPQFKVTVRAYPARV